MRHHRPVQSSIQFGNQAVIKGDFGMMNPGQDTDFYQNNPIGRSIPDNYIRRQPNNQMPFNIEPFGQSVQTLSTTNKNERRTKK